MASMGFGPLGDYSLTWKRKFRWMFFIDNYVGDRISGSTNALVPYKGARPQLQFKEIEVNHIFEDIFLPGRPDWRPINLVLYETCPPKDHPVWNWINVAYEVQAGQFHPIISGNGYFKTNAYLSLYDGGGGEIETWAFENAWPQNINFGELDMASNDVVSCEITLRYDRAYKVDFSIGES